MIPKSDTEIRLDVIRNKLRDVGISEDWREDVEWLIDKVQELEVELEDMADYD